MEQHSVSLGQDFNYPYCLIWLEKENIKIEINTKDPNEILEMYYVLTMKDVLLEEMVKELSEKDKDTVLNIINSDSSDKTVVEPIEMSRPK